MVNRLLDGLFGDGGILRVRALIAFALVGTLCVGFMRGMIEADLFVPISFASTAYYFATRGS